MFTIRPFQSADEERVIDIWRACKLVVPWNEPSKDIGCKTAFQPDLFFVVLENKNVIGTVMAGYEGHRGWIHYLAVDPEFQGRGVGRLLMEHAEQRLKAMGCPKINLQVRTGNRAVIAFYRKLGYQVDEVVCMGKRIRN